MKGLRGSAHARLQEENAFLAAQLLQVGETAKICGGHLQSLRKREFGDKKSDT